MHVLIVGDSFAADWSVKYPDVQGWPNLLSQHHQVTNLAQAGVSEYRILQQVHHAGDLARFDRVVVCHTSPYRLVTRRHPIHYNDPLHGSADLMLTDIEHHARGWRNWFDRSLNHALGFFHYHYDPTYQEVIYDLMYERINVMLSRLPTVALRTRLIPDTAPWLANTVDITAFGICPGQANHLSENNNIAVAEMINKSIS